MTQVVTVQAASTELNVSRRTVYRMLARGILSALYINPKVPKSWRGRDTRIRTQSIIAFKQQQSRDFAALN